MDKKTLILLTVLTGGFLLVSWLASVIFLSWLGVEGTATPITILNYLKHYPGHKSVQDKALFSYVAALAIIVAPFAIDKIIKQNKKRSLYGDAKFANDQDIKKAGLYGDNGVIVGKNKGKYLVFGGNQHPIMIAPTRSGKGVGIVIPNLLAWTESVVVLDIKQENWDITSRFRAEKLKQDCYLFNPLATDYRTHRYNPLNYISDDENFRIDDVQKIANMLYADNGEPSIWTSTPRALFTGIVLMLIETGKPLTMFQVLLEANQGDGAEYLLDIIHKQKQIGKPLSPICETQLNTYCSIASENTRAGIITGFRSALELWTNPLVQEATNGNDFDFRDVRKKKMSIYVGVTPDNLDRLKPLLNLFFQQLIDANVRELPESNPDLKYKCLLLMDEFTSLGRVNVLSKGIAYIAGYNLRMMPIIQSPSQLVQVYGKEEAKTFEANHACYIVFAPKASDVETAEHLSKTLGNQTVKGFSTSRAKGQMNNQGSLSTSDHGRALLLPQEISALGGDNALVIIENTPPILCKKIKYYEDDVFLSRLRMVSPTLSKMKKMAIKGKHYNQAMRDGELSADVPLINLVKKGVEKTMNIVQGSILSGFRLKLEEVVAPILSDSINQEALDSYADNLCLQAGINVY